MLCPRNCAVAYALAPKIYGDPCLLIFKHFADLPRIFTAPHLLILKMFANLNSYNASTSGFFCLLQLYTVKCTSPYKAAVSRKISESHERKQMYFSVLNLVDDSLSCFFWSICQQIGLERSLFVGKLGSNEVCLSAHWGCAPHQQFSSALPLAHFAFFKRSAIG